MKCFCSLYLEQVLSWNDVPGKKEGDRTTFSIVRQQEMKSRTTPEATRNQRNFDRAIQFVRPSLSAEKRKGARRSDTHYLRKLPRLGHLTVTTQL